jgi:predicted transcriptional regulator
MQGDGGKYVACSGVCECVCIWRRSVMVSRDGASTRKDRLQLMMDLITKHQNQMSENKIKGIFMLQTGLTRRKIDEYFQDLIDVEVIERRNGNVRMLI